ncbi:MAG: transposase [Synergistaceae bacterium]|nr:transposase [Synergistaceae bacterium]
MDGWTCPRCGAKHDRDINVAINIIRVGASTLKVLKEKTQDRFQSAVFVDLRIP